MAITQKIVQQWADELAEHGRTKVRFRFLALVAQRLPVALGGDGDFPLLEGGRRVQADHRGGDGEQRHGERIDDVRCEAGIGAGSGK